MNNLTFTSQAWGEYCYWQNQDKKTLKKINLLIQDIQRNQFVGIGKPEPLKNGLGGLWSRRIDNANRLVYKIEDEQIQIIQCKGHYQDK